ncbi:MAG: FKBP-type peptidyl-prolyl cis-trans isomerase [Bacteroidales bacterium]|nr:FKBP-type peptidyl-prolyl cis-trans isomerase [Bacteroidales bacterium]
MSKKEEYKKANLIYVEEEAKKTDVIVLPDGVVCEILKSGDGKSPTHENVISVFYKGMLINGKVFDSNLSSQYPEPFRLNEVIKGWQIVLPRMKVGDTWKITIPPHLGYGARSVDGIPKNSTLIFEITLVDIF